MASDRVGVRSVGPYPSNEPPGGTVLMLPGRAYPCERPLLAGTTAALQASGWTVLQASWSLPVLPPEPQAFVEAAAQMLEDHDRAEGPVLVVAKSLGTLAAHWAAERGYAAAWLTPVLTAAGRHPLPEQSAALAGRLRDYPVASLVVGGTADPLWAPGFRSTGTVLEVNGADHGLEVADQDQTWRHHARVTAAVADLAASLS